MTKDIRVAIRNAADWLEANPDNHVQYHMAAKRGYDGELIDVDIPEGECFCAVGRIAFELGLSDHPHSLEDELQTLFLGAAIQPSPGTIEATNDRLINEGRKADVINFLRRIIE